MALGFESIFYQTQTNRGALTCRTASGRTYILEEICDAEGERINAYRGLHTHDLWDVRFETQILDEEGNLHSCPSGKIAVYRWAGTTGDPWVYAGEFRRLLQIAEKSRKDLEAEDAYQTCSRDAFDSLTTRA